LLVVVLPLSDEHARDRLAVWDLESGVQCPGYADIHSTSACIHRANDKHVIAYTTTEKPGNTGVFEWTAYQFSLDEPVKQLRDRLQANVEPGLEWRI
jgi:hypothetical protein